jgi:predicted ATPase
MPVERVKLENFTAFQKLDIELSPGINVFIGANGTGKTHLLKVLYAACDITKTKSNFAEKLIRIFLPSNRALGRLVARQKGSSECTIELYRGRVKLSMSFTNHAVRSESATITGKDWNSQSIESVYIPVKEMLAHGPGFRSLYAQREVHFEEIYADILDRAYRPTLRGPIDSSRKDLLARLQKVIAGKVIVKDEEFFLRNQQGNLEFSLLSEGFRKLGLLWLLIQNGTLLNGSVLFWDEPETNLNPKACGALMEVLFHLQRMGVQVFLATHNYVILKELDLRKTRENEVLFHSLYWDAERGEMLCTQTDEYLQIHPNAIHDTFLDLFDRDVARDLEASQ